MRPRTKAWPLAALLTVLLSPSGCNTPARHDSPHVTVLGQGTGAPARLGPRLESGHEETVEVELSLSARGSVNGRDGEASSVSTLHFAAQLTVTAVDDGGVRGVVTIPRLAIGPAPAGSSELTRTAHQRLRTAIEEMPQLEGEIVVTRECFPSKVELGAAARKALSNQQRQVVELLRSTLAQLIVPRPAAASLPARWSADLDLTRNGFSVMQSQDSELDPGGTLRLHLSERPADGADTASPPGVYADRVSVNHLDGGGTGQVLLDVDHVFPRSARIELSSLTELAVEQAGRTDRVRSHATLVIQARQQDRTAEL